MSLYNSGAMYDPSALAAVLIGQASNIITGDNPAYTADDFFAYYGHFVGKIPLPVLNTFIRMATATVKQARWNSDWEYGMANHIAHHAYLFLQVTPAPGADAGDITAAGQAQGVITSESAGPVSYTQDQGQIAEDLKGWGVWKLSSYGQQFASKARLYAAGGMYVQ